MTAPPTWRDLGLRARRLGVKLEHGPHEARVSCAFDWNTFTSWLGHRADQVILRTAIAAALEQLERPTRRGRKR